MGEGELELFNELWGFKSPTRQAARIEASAKSPDALFLGSANADSLTQNVITYSPLGMKTAKR
jgi:hypothetical protein